MALRRLSLLARSLSKRHVQTLRDTVLPTTTPSPNTFLDQNQNTAYFAFKIEDPKVDASVARVHEAALKVSTGFTPRLIKPKQFFQPIVSFYMKQQEENVRVPKLVEDRVLYSQLDLMIPHRINYTKFKVVDGAMTAVAEHHDGINDIKKVLREALAMHGFVIEQDWDGYLPVIKKPAFTSTLILKDNLIQRPLNASVDVTSLFICRGGAPIAQITGPISFPLVDDLQWYVPTAKDYLFDMTNNIPW